MPFFLTTYVLLFKPVFCFIYLLTSLMSSREPPLLLSCFRYDGCILSAAIAGGGTELEGNPVAD